MGLADHLEETEWSPLSRCSTLWHKQSDMHTISVVCTNMYGWVAWQGQCNGMFTAQNYAG